MLYFIFEFAFIFKVKIRHVHYFVKFINVYVSCQTASNKFKYRALAAIGPALYEVAESPEFD